MMALTFQQIHGKMLFKIEVLFTVCTNIMQTCFLMMKLSVTFITGMIPCKMALKHPQNYQQTRLLNCLSFLVFTFEILGLTLYAQPSCLPEQSIFSITIVSFLIVNKLNTISCATPYFIFQHVTSICTRTKQVLTRQKTTYAILTVRQFLLLVENECQNKLKCKCNWQLLHMFNSVYLHALCTVRVLFNQ